VEGPQRSCRYMSPPGETFVPVQANAFHTAFVSACICASIRLTGRSFTLPNVYILNRHIDYSNSRFLIQRYEARLPVHASGAS